MCNYERTIQEKDESLRLINKMYIKKTYINYLLGL